MPEDRTLSAKQRRLIEGLLLHGEVAAAARQAGASRDSAYRWLRDPAVAAALKAAERQAVEAAVRSLARLAATAARTLEAAMTDAAVPAGTRVRAADAALARLLQIRELVDLDERLARLEEAAEVHGVGR